MQEKDLKIVHGLGEIIIHATSVNKALQQIVDHIVLNIRVKLCTICVYDKQKQSLRVSICQGISEKDQYTFKAENSPTSYAFEKGKIVNTLLSSPRFANNPNKKLLMPEINSVLSIPLIACGQTLGVLSIGQKQHKIFSKRILDLCEIVSSALAVFLLNNDMSSSLNNLPQMSQTVTPPTLADPECSAVLQNRNTKMFHGKSIVEGVSRGKAVVLADDNALDKIQLERTDNPEKEKKLFAKARKIGQNYLAKIQKEISVYLAEMDSGIFTVHTMLLNDPMLCGRVEKYIDLGYQLDSALSLTLKEFTKEYMAMDDQYIRERLSDIKDVLIRLKNTNKNMSHSIFSQKNSKNTGISANEQRIILVARELLPSQLFASPIASLQGIICESGGSTSHAAILAKALRIPMLIDIPDIHNIVKGGDSILLDSNADLCYIHPTPALIKQYRIPLAHFRKITQKIEKENDTGILPLNKEVAKTKDNIPIKLSGNLTLISELPTLQKYGIRDIGLYRTEFLFLIRNTMPSEEDQYRVFAKIVDRCKGASVIIRALDIGGDKPLSYIHWDIEENPSLGCRGLRFLLTNLDFLHIHLRAILRATAIGDVKILFPMITDLLDIRTVKEALKRAENSLRKEGIPFSDHYKIGAMIETPSSVFCLEQLLNEVDFINIGTNDLVQYTFAVDRNNSKVNRWYRQTHPIVLRILGHICKIVDSFPEKQVCLCGELAANVNAIPVLIGAGLRHFSMTSTPIPAVREYINKLDIPECEKLYKQAINCISDSEVIQLIKKFAKHHGIHSSPHS